MVFFRDIHSYLFSLPGLALEAIMSNHCAFSCEITIIAHITNKHFLLFLRLSDVQSTNIWFCKKEKKYKGTLHLECRFHFQNYVIYSWFFLCVWILTFTSENIRQWACHILSRMQPEPQGAPVSRSINTLESSTSGFHHINTPTDK